MKAFVCDKCGKVILLEDDKAYYAKSNGVYHLVSDKMEHCEIDLCEDCAKELMSAVRNMKGESV
jgi:Fe2+ or Zn2+ uptake regulation protein